MPSESLVRQQFEQWYLRQFSYDMSGKYRKNTDDYNDPDADHAWSSWQEATRLSQPSWTFCSEEHPVDGRTITFEDNSGNLNIGYKSGLFYCIDAGGKIHVDDVIKWTPFSEAL